MVNQIGLSDVLMQDLTPAVSVRGCRARARRGFAFAVRGDEPAFHRREGGRPRGAGRLASQAYRQEMERDKHQRTGG